MISKINLILDVELKIMLKKIMKGEVLDREDAILLSEKVINLYESEELAWERVCKIDSEKIA